jgi:hypothetical protein
MVSNRVESRLEMPLQRGLLSTEVAVSIGCVGCTAEFTGYYLATTPHKDARKRLADDLCAAAEITDVPVTVGLSSNLVTVGQAAERCEGSRPCANQDNRGMFEEILAEFVEL